MVNTVRGAISAHQREVSNVARVIRGGLPEDLRKAAAGAIEKNNFREFTPTQKKFVDAYSSFVGYVGKAAIEAGVLGDVLERYVTHLVEKEPLSKTMISDFIDELLNPKSSGGGFKTTSPFAKGRKYPTLEELGKALEGSGLRIKTTDIADLAEVYGKSMWEAIERKRFVEALKAAKPERENGAGWVMDAKKAPSSYRTIDSAQLRGLSVHPDLAGPLRFLMEPSKLPLPLHVMRVISSAVKRNVFLGSLFHVKTLGEAAVMAMGAKGLVEIGRSIGQGLGLEKHFGKSAVKAALEKYWSGGPGDWVDDLIKGGLNVNHIDDMNPNALRELGRTADSFLGKFGFLEKTLGGMEDIQKKLIDELTWNYTHMGGKLAVAHHLIEGEVLRNKKLPEGEQLPEQEIVKQVATAVNNFMGGQDWFRIASEAQTQIGRELAMGTFGPAGRAIIGLVALAPDWNISTFRAVWKALPGKTDTQVTQRLSAAYALRSAFFYFVIMDQVNNAMSGHHMWSKEQKDPTRVELPNGSQIQFGKHAFEVVELLHKPGQTLLAKGNPLAKLPIELAMGKEYLSSGYAPAMENPLAHIAGTVLPLSIKGAMAPYRTPEEAAKRAVLNAMGLPITGLTHEEEARRKVMSKEKSADKKANELPETRDARERKKLLRELQ